MATAEFNGGFNDQFVIYTLSPAVTDSRDQKDIRWILNYGRVYGATKTLTVHQHQHAPDPDVPFEYEIKTDQAAPHVFDVIMSFGRRFAILLVPLVHHIKRRIGDSLLGGPESMILAQHNVTRRMELHVRYLSRAAVPHTMPVDDGTGERDLKRRRKDE